MILLSSIVILSIIALFATSISLNSLVLSFTNNPKSLNSIVLPCVKLLLLFSILICPIVLIPVALNVLLPISIFPKLEIIEPDSSAPTILVVDEPIPLRLSVDFHTKFPLLSLDAKIKFSVGILFGNLYNCCVSFLNIILFVVRD